MGNLQNKYDVLPLQYMQMILQEEEIYECFSGGGLYDQKCNGMKIGKRIELDKGFYNGKQITHIGEYKTGKKFDIWDIWCIKQYIHLRGRII
ncbi:unnamed protein product [Paramecium pentaurelia]|uniref:Uncharacterized protein n=1 Tax=Paramecium pentaurelia TaxID=43138 RepID=A0A8S1YGW1_9CILI|nr:unnamed protein product [Paramecium pentaurelia]